jgi:hypothetical protein
VIDRVRNLIEALENIAVLEQQPHPSLVCGYQVRLNVRILPPVLLRITTVWCTFAVDGWPNKLDGVTEFAEQDVGPMHMPLKLGVCHDPKLPITSSLRAAVVTEDRPLQIQREQSFSSLQDRYVKEFTYLSSKLRLLPREYSKHGPQQA